jgi:uncharacterized GH25 family protein
MRYFYVFLFLLVSGSIIGHDHWIEAKNFKVSKGDTVNLKLILGDFLEPAYEIALRKNQTRSFSVRTDSVIQEFSNSMADSLKPLLSFKAENPGLNLITIEKEHSFIQMDYVDFLEYLVDEKQVKASEIFEKMYPKKPVKERYTRYIKSLIAVDNAEGNIYKARTNARLEFIFLNNPYKARKKDYLLVQLLYDGKPLIKTAVHAFHRNRDGQTYSYRLETNDEGNFSIQLSYSGIWLFRSVYIQPCLNCKNADWESFWTSYTFATEF